MFWKTQDNPWIAARNARKNPPILISMLLYFALFWGYMYAAYGLRELIFGGISAILGSLIENGTIQNLEYAIYDDLNVIAYSFTFILLVPLGILYVRLIEGRNCKSFMLHKNHFFSHFFLGFLIGTAVLAAVLGFLSIFRIFTISGIGDFHWLSFLLGTLCILLMCFSEEYFFRGAVLSSFGARNHPLVAILAAAVLSSVCNYFYFNNIREMNFFLIVNHILLGCLLGILVYRTHSLTSAVGVRVALLFLSQLIFGIPFSNYYYVHSVFESKYTTVSIWFTTDVIPGVDTGFGMFVMLLLALIPAVFLSGRSTKKQNVQQTTFFRHVQPTNPADPLNTEPQSQTDSVSKPHTAEDTQPSISDSPVSVEQTQSPKMVNTDAVEEENWEDEETRAPITPNYQSPEDYLKK